MAKKLTIVALGLAVMGCGAAPSNGTSANDATALETVNALAPEPTADNAVSVPGATTGQGNANDHAIRFADGSALDLQAVKTDEKKGLSDAQCAVVIGEQRIETVGSGELDAYSCGALVEVGALPPAGQTRRIGLIYRVSSPNAQFQTALVLVEQGGRWTLDPDSIGTHDDAPEARSIEALAKSVGGAR